IFIGLQVFSEEYVFRGYLLAGLFSLSRSYLLSACLSSLAFALVHQPESLAASAIPFIFGLLCCEFRRLFGGIEFSFGYHLVWNAVSETGIMPNFQWYDNSGDAVPDRFLKTNKRLEYRRLVPRRPIASAVRQVISGPICD